MVYAVPKQIGDHNKNQIIGILREQGHASRIELSRMLGISATAVSRNIAKLLEVGIIRESGSDHAAMGRKPVLLELCADYGYVIGADVVGGSVGVALADLYGRILHYEEEPSDPAGGTVFQHLVHALDRLMADLPVPQDKIYALCLGAPGIFNPEAGTSRFSLFRDGWEGIDLKKELEARYGIETIVDNDVNLDVIGESWKGAGRDFDSILYVKVGEGIASRIVLQGKPLRGWHDAAGEIGFMRPSNRGGSYEELMCSQALAAMYQDKSGGGGAKPATLSDLLTLRGNGDEAARQVVAAALEYLWVVLLNCVSVLDPQVILLGGDGGSLDEADTDYLSGRIAQHLPPARTILTSRLDKKACIFGAISTALDRVEELVLALL